MIDDELPATLDTPCSRRSEVATARLKSDLREERAIGSGSAVLANAAALAEKTPGHLAPAAPAQDKT